MLSKITAFFCLECFKQSEDKRNIKSDHKYGTYTSTFCSVRSKIMSRFCRSLLPLPAGKIWVLYIFILNWNAAFSAFSASGKSERHKCDICSLDYVLCFSKPCLQMISPLDYVLLLFETLISEIRMSLGQISTLICKLFRKIIYFFTKRKSVLWRLQLTSHTGTSNFSFSKVTQIHFWFHKYSQNYFDISSLASFNHYKSFLRTNSLKNNSKILYFKKSINRYLSDVKLKFFTTVISATFIPARGNHQFLIFHFFRFSHFFRFLLLTLQIHII